MPEKCAANAFVPKRKHLPSENHEFHRIRDWGIGPRSAFRFPSIYSIQQQAKDILPIRVIGEDARVGGI